MNDKKLAFLFSGQGAQYIGMGKELYDNIPECKEIFDKGQRVLEMPIKEMIFDGTKEEIMKTENAQPTILLTSLAILKALELNEIEAEYTTGLSLGEYGSLIYSKALSFEEGLNLVKTRGMIMGSALPKGLGKMAAIMKLSNEQVDEVIQKASAFGICEGANYNCPGQVVIAGENQAIDQAIIIAKDLGGKAIPLRVSGPFHSSLLKDASEKFYKTLEKVNIKEMKKTVYSNVKGEPYSKDDDIKLLLKKHIMSGVLFEKTIKDMLNEGVETFIEIGPGKVLSGFVKKINKDVTVLNVEDLKTLKNAIGVLKGEEIIC